MPTDTRTDIEVSEEKGGPGQLAARFPDAFTILFGLIIVVAVLTWILPAGQYERQMNEAVGREVAVPGTYHQTEADPHRRRADRLPASTIPRATRPMRSTSRSSYW